MVTVWCGLGPLHYHLKLNSSEGHLCVYAMQSEVLEGRDVV